MNREIENVLAKFFGSSLGGVLPHENVRLRNICGLQSRAKLSLGSCLQHTCMTKKREKKNLDVRQSSSFHLLEKDITVRFTEAIKAGSLQYMNEKKNKLGVLHLYKADL